MSTSVSVGSLEAGASIFIQHSLFPKSLGAYGVVGSPVAFPWEQTP